MTTNALMFRVRPAENGDLVVEVSPNQFKEPVEVPWNPPRMIGGSRHPRPQIINFQ